MCAKTLNVEVVERLKKQIPVILCKLEKILPPAFFDVTMHLPIHLPEEAHLRGPIHYGWMFLVERKLGYLKGTVHKKERPEGSIAETYIIDESSTFVSRYFKGDIETRFNIADRTICTEGRKMNKKGKPIEGELSMFSSIVHGIRSKDLCLFLVEKKAEIHRYILDNCSEVEPYIE